MSEEKKKKRKIWLIVIAIFFVMMIGVAGMAALAAGIIKAVSGSKDVITDGTEGEIIEELVSEEQVSEETVAEDGNEQNYDVKEPTLGMNTGELTENATEYEGDYAIQLLTEEELEYKLKEKETKSK